MRRKSLLRRLGPRTRSPPKVVRAIPPRTSGLGVRKKVGVTVVVLVVLLGVFLVYQLEAQAQQASQKQQEQAIQSVQQIIQQQQNQTLLGQTAPASLNPGQSQEWTQYLTAGKNVTLELVAVGTTTVATFFGTVCYSLAAPSGTWLVGNGKSQLTCVVGPRYLHQFVPTENGNYSLYVQAPTSGNYEQPIQVTAIFTGN